MIEMDIGIIAASLVVMRPVIQLISHKITGKETPGHALSGSRGPSAYIHMSGSGSGARKRTEYGRGITKTVEVELESRNVSTENILGHGKRG
jgi:hypothetical protein